MSENEVVEKEAESQPKKNLVPFFVFLLVIVFAGGGIAFGILWFTNRPTQGEDTAAFLPPDTKLAVHISGLAELYEHTKKWGMDDMLAMAGGPLDMSGLEQVVDYCKTQVRGDCRMLIAIREFEPEDPNATATMEPILMLEGREHQAMLKLLAASGEFGDLKLEDEGPDIKRVEIAPGENLYLTTRGPFIAASRDVKHIKFINLSKDKPYKSSASQEWLQRWTNSQVGFMLDFPAWRQRFDGKIDEVKQEIQAAQQDGSGMSDATRKMSEALFKVLDELRNSTRGVFAFSTLNDDGLKLQVVADVKEDSAYGKSLASLANDKSKFELLGAIPKGYAFYAGSSSSLKKVKPLMDLQQAVQGAIMGSDSPNLLDAFNEVGSGTSFVFGQGISQVAVYNADKPQTTIDNILKTHQAAQKSGIYDNTSVKTTIEENAGELRGMKFHKITTDLGLNQMDPGGEAGAMMGMMFGSGVMTQWIGADDTYIYQLTGPALEDLETTLDHLTKKKDGVGSESAFEEALGRIDTPRLAAGLMDLETLVAPVAMFVAPGLIKPGDSPLYIVTGLAAPQSSLALDFFLPKKLVEKAQQAAQQMSQGMGGLGGGLGGGMGGSPGMADPDPFGSFDDSP